MEIHEKVPRKTYEPILTLKKCDMCDFTTKRMQHLKIHIDSIHNGIKHKCDICLLDYSSKANLLIHKNTQHLGVRYSCDKCDQIFKQNCQLKSHKMIHEDENNQSKQSDSVFRIDCTFCNKQYKTIRCLELHVKKQHLNNSSEHNTFNCNICEFVSTIKKAMGYS